jgi:hypothetical protein
VRTLVVSADGAVLLDSSALIDLQHRTIPDEGLGVELWPVGE